MGTAFDRTREHQGTADAGQIQMRRRLINAARALREEGVAPPASQDPSAYAIRPVEALLPRSEKNWEEAIRMHMRPGGTYTSVVS